jgi:prepilin-type N-terminal cleavage/methylation domain-containing protein
VAQRQAVRPLLQQQNKSIQPKLLKSNQGFTVIEILIALFLIVTVFAIAGGQVFSTSKDLDKDTTDIERAIHFMSDEAALRNAVVRLHFLLGKAPQEYAVEYGPSDSFILPPEPEFNAATLSKEEEEKAEKKTKEVNLKFNKVQEYQDSNAEISDDVKILGIGSVSSQKLKTTGDMSIYAFPTGEKDGALILVANDEAVVSLEVDPFTNKVEKKTYKIDMVGKNREIADIWAEKAKEIFETWLKEKK